MRKVVPLRRKLYRRHSVAVSTVSVLRLTILGGFAAALALLQVADGESGPSAIAATGDMLSARFALCGTGGGRDCVVDGDTFWMGGEKIRIADIDTPETHAPRCPAEAGRGAEATKRMHALLNAGPFSLKATDRDSDRYGRKLRVVTRNGNSLGGILVDEGLARWYGGGRRPWC